MVNSLNSVSNNTILLSVLVFIVFFFMFSLLGAYLNKKYKFPKIKISLIIVFILITLRVILEIHEVTWNKSKLNAIIYIGIMFFVIKLFDYMIIDFYAKKTKFEMPKLIHDIIIMIIYIVAFFSILKMQLGIDITPLLTTSAVISMVIGLALQDTLSNFIAGIVIHIESPFKYNDWIGVNNIDGRVIEINWRTVKILTFSNDFYIIPNSIIAKSQITNYNAPTKNHLRVIKIRASYDESPNKIKEIILETAKEIPYVLKDPDPIINIVDYQEYYIEYNVRLWIDDFGKKRIVTDEFLSKLWYKLKRENIRPPYKRQEIYNFESNKIVDCKYEALEEKIFYLKSIDLFKNMEKNVLEKIVNKMNEMFYGKKEILFRQGDEGDSFFLIYKGEVDIFLDNEKIATLKKGDFFGEMSLLLGKNRTATTIAKTDLKCFVIDKINFSIIIQTYPEILETISKTLSNRETLNMENKNNTKNNLKETTSFSNEKNILRMLKDFFNI
ncbi:MAG: mechanosensitive ion channel [Fusobacteria bacterium]|nr:mechanosensitive ion channel [Fusobacteriota bacterium]